MTGWCYEANDSYRSGAGDEATGRNVAGNGQADHMVSGGKVVRVRLPPSAPIISTTTNIHDSSLNFCNGVKSVAHIGSLKLLKKSQLTWLGTAPHRNNSQREPQSILRAFIEYHDQEPDARKIPDWNIETKS